MISASHGHSMALLNDGKVVCWGYNGNKQYDVPASIQGQVKLS
jgi:alpha-tubulin suppressor-like RCC1 family protein